MAQSVYLQKHANGDLTMRHLLLLLVVLALSTPLWAASSLEVVLPDQSTTSVAFNFTVTARDGAAVDPSYVGTVHFTSSDPGATLPADYTFTLADAGTRTFSATMANSGPDISTANQTITATDTVTASITGTDVTTVKWAPDVVRRILPNVPEEVNRTVSFQGTVAAINADHQVVPGYTGTVHFIGTTGVALPADYTFTPADNSVHTFTFTASNGGFHVITADDVSNPALGSSDTFYVYCPELRVSASNNGPVCPGQPTTLFATPNQSDVTYSWGGPFGLFSTLQNPDVFHDGAYFVQVRSAIGCVASDQTLVTYKPTSESPDIAVSTTRICGVDPLTATLTNASSFTNLVWVVHEGQVIAGQGTASVQVTPTPNAGTMIIQVSGTHVATGCTFEQKGTRYIDVEPAHSTEITTSSSCSGGPRFASVPVSGANALYDWSITNGQVLTGPGQPTITWEPSGTQDVTISVTVTRADSCVASDSVTVPAGTGPYATIDTQTWICPGEDATIPVSLSGTPPFSITWNDGVTQNGINAHTASRTVSPSQYSEYTITNVTDAQCSGTANGIARVMIDAEPEITQQPGNTTIAKGSSAKLTVAASGSVTSYSWYQGQTGDRSRLVAFGPSFTTPHLTSTTSYWVEVVGECETVQSTTATVTVSGGRRRAVRR